MRIWRAPMANPDDPPEGDYRDYVGFQKIINSYNGQVDENILEEHVDMILSDERFLWKELSPIDFGILRLGDRIRYTTLTQKDEYLFRTGGWVMAIDENLEWLVYRAHTHTNWTIQEKDLVRLWYTRKISKKKNKHVVYRYKTPSEEKKYNSYLPDKNGIMQRVYSTNVKQEHTKFENTTKFKSALESKSWEFI